MDDGEAAAAREANRRAPLAAFNGDAPPAPRWFRDAVAVEPATSRVTVAGAALECLTWGDAGKPGEVKSLKLSALDKCAIDRKSVV